jgi:hypothetical protein
MHDDIAAHYLEEARRQFRGHKRLAEAAMAQLKDEDFFIALDSESNSIAVIVKHLAGNMRSRFTDFLTTDGEKPDRNRDTEFEMNSGTTRTDVMGTVTIRGEPHTAMQAINRQIAHYAQHTGQLVFLAKHLRSSMWKSLSIPRGKSKDLNTLAQKYEKGVIRERPEGR